VAVAVAVGIAQMGKLDSQDHLVDQVVAEEPLILGPQGRVALEFRDKDLQAV